MEKFKHMLTYIGNGKWIDSTGKIWTNGISEDFETDMDKDTFLNDREDFKFMVQYGTMRISSMSIGVSAPSNQFENQGNTTEKPGSISKTDTKTTTENKPEDGVKKINIVNAK